MFISIDWLSVSFKMEVTQQAFSHRLWDRAGDALKAQFPLLYDRMVADQNYTPRLGRAPYNASMRREDNGVVVFAHQMLEHGLVEIGGIGMDTLGGLDGEVELASSVASRCTRIDIAVDIFTDILPPEFTAYRDAGRFKAWSEAVSETGHTVYVGSKTSDRYARVYRYNPPHPRCQFLRVEHVLKAEQARMGIVQMTEGGLERFVAALGNTFGWTHPLWTPAVNTDEAVSAWRPERRAGKTVAWLHSAVLPALLRLHRDGTIDARQFFADHILPELDKPQG